VYLLFLDIYFILRRVINMSKFDSKSFNPQAFGAYIERVPQLKKNELIRSGALKGNAEIKNAFSSQTGTAYAILPMYGLLDGDVQNYDGQTDITAASTTTYERGVVVIGRQMAWTEGDFSTDITGGVDFMSNVAQQVSAYFDGVDQSTLLAILDGIFAMTGTANKEFVDNHTYDITAVNDGLAGETTLNSAIQQAGGDNKSKFTMVIMHSVVATHLENLKLLAYLKQTDANGIERELGLATWNGRTVIVDDDMPTTAVAKSGDTEAYTSYTTYVLGTGAIDYENIGAKVPYEMDRDPAKNGGQDTLYVRQRKCYAPYGISYTKKKQATLSPEDDELVNDGNGKTINHRAIPICRIISKG
jgi:hypothetical protein